MLYQSLLSNSTILELYRVSFESISNKGNSRRHCGRNRVPFASYPLQKEMDKYYLLCVDFLKYCNYPNSSDDFHARILST
jgi:hypothetical protein